MNVLVLLDPLATLKPPADTSLLLMKECQRRGCTVYACEHEDLFVEQGVPFALAVEVKIDRRGYPVVQGKRRKVRLSQCGLVLFRKDPPFDNSYLHATHIVELAEGVTAINSPAGLRKANEKLYALNFPDAMPETILTRDRETAWKFVSRMGRVVGKPIDSFGGIGVAMLRKDDPGSRAIIDILTLEGRTFALFQKFVQGADKRVFVLDGEVRGVMGRRRPKGEFRANFHVGGYAAKSRLTRAETARLEPILPVLVRDGLRFVGIDLIGGYLSEINVTSPTGFWQYYEVSGRRLWEEWADSVGI